MQRFKFSKRLRTCSADVGKIKFTLKLSNAVNITIANIVAACAAFVLLMKRKDDDVLPTPFVKAQAAKHAQGPRFWVQHLRRKMNL